MNDRQLCERACDITDPDQVSRAIAGRLTRIAISFLVCDIELTDDDREFLIGLLPNTREE